MAKKKMEIDFSDLLGDDEISSQDIAPAGSKLASYAAEQIGPAKAIVLFWTQFKCACGSSYYGPAFHNPVLLRHDHLKHVCFGHYRADGEIFSPVHGKSIPSNLPIELHYDSQEIPVCPTCATAEKIQALALSPDKAFDQMHECALTSDSSVASQGILMWDEYKEDKLRPVRNMADLKKRYVAAQAALKDWRKDD